MKTKVMTKSLHRGFHVCTDQGSFHGGFHVCTNQGNILRSFLTNSELKVNNDVNDDVCDCVGANNDVNNG
jgi:hypothetical protein